MALISRYDAQDVAGLPRGLGFDAKFAPSPLRLPYQIAAPDDLAMRLDGLVEVFVMIGPGPQEGGVTIGLNSEFQRQDGQEKTLAWDHRVLEVPQVAAGGHSQIAYQVPILAWLDHDWRVGQIGFAIGYGHGRITDARLSVRLIATPMRNG